jgi:serine phosphatase RsbU (regulator of sigma subunit)
MSKRMRILLGGALLALMTVNLGATVYSVFLPKKGSWGGWSGSWEGKGDPLVTGIDADGRATDLQVGDEIIAINGIKVREDPSILNHESSVPPGTHYTMTIRRAGRLHDIEAQTVPHKPNRGFSPANIVILLFLVTGWFVFLLRPDDKQAWLLALMLGTLTGIMGGDSPTNLPLWLSLFVGSARALGLLFLPIFVHFFLIFPETSPLVSRWPHLETWIYLPCLLVILPVMGSPRLLADIRVWFFKYQWLQTSVAIALALVTLYLAAGLVCLLINYRAASLAARRRLRVVMAGSAAGFFNLFLVVIGEVTGLEEMMEVTWDWVEWATLFTFPLIPLSFVYAIVRHRVIPVSLIIRRGVRYLLVKRGSILLVMAGVSVVMFFVMDTFFSYLKPGSGRTVGIISAVIAVAVWHLARAFHLRVVAPKVDRLFFHQAYDTQQIMAELAESLRMTTSLPRLLELVATKIQSALHTTNATILLRDEASGDYLSAYSCEYSFHNRSAMQYPCDCRLPRNSAAIAWMAETGQPIDLDGGDQQFHMHSENGHPSVLSGEEREVLQQLKSALLLPIVSKDGLLGVISLGSHLGDLPFSSEDKKLLLSVSGPASLALENSRLIERMVEDARQRQELEAENEQRAKELEGARQLQLSMLPKQIPQLPHLDIAAYMRPATEVGGDYYDFHVADDGALTIAVGDATGHGLKAGTVVTAMKSLFHCYAGEPELHPVLNQSSRVLKKMNLRSMFMGLTVIRLKDCSLKISSAGMPPVLIYRARDGVVDEVLIKAVPLGSISSYQYRELEMDVSLGDVVVMMSDGLPERFNQEGEMFDYARVKEALTEAGALSSQQIIDHFVESGEKWANGRLQDDDMTFVVLKKNKPFAD